MSNHLKNQTSPYLLQHAENPVEWYPWCEEAFVRARMEDKPIFLSIGYSTCHSCHVMAEESYENEQVAELLNRHFISIKVDKEERPDIDSVYMAVCQTFTGSGGWPTTIFMTPDQKPFFAGTYFPKHSAHGYTGFIELLTIAYNKWQTDRTSLLQAADAVIKSLKVGENRTAVKRIHKEGSLADRAGESVLDTAQLTQAFQIYKQTFDETYGGFGNAPKFPSPHNLLFLMRYYEQENDGEAMRMAEKTLQQMYYGGMFDHIGGGFSRYSTDRYFLVPHFEKMLYDNALLILAYVKAYEKTKNDMYRMVAEKTAGYILREMTSAEGGFYSAQDADSEGEEGKYYVFEPDEVCKVLGRATGLAFCQHFDITETGNFEGKSIPNLLKGAAADIKTPDFRVEREMLYEYRKNRFHLHLDDKILTSWNGLMIAAMAGLYSVTKAPIYLETAENAQKFIERNLCENNRLFVSWRNGQSVGNGFLDDYANEIFALLALYEVTQEEKYLDLARAFCDRTEEYFYDRSRGGYYMSGAENEQLIFRPKETYDGAMFSGNSAMAYNLVRLFVLTGESKYQRQSEQQLEFMSAAAASYPAGHSMYLVALMEYLEAVM